MLLVLVITVLSSTFMVKAENDVPLAPLGPEKLALSSEPPAPSSQGPDQQSEAPSSEAPALTNEANSTISASPEANGASESTQSLSSISSSSLAPLNSQEPDSSSSRAPSIDLSSSAAPALEFEPNVTAANEQRNSSPAIEIQSSSTPLEQSSSIASSSASAAPLNLAPSNASSLEPPPAKIENSPSVEPRPNSSENSAERNRNDSNNARFLLPSKLDRIRVTIIGFTGKPVRTFNLSEDQVLYQMKVFWGEPESWQDIGWPASDRIFELSCWLATNGGFIRNLFRGNLSGSLITHSQWYAFPEAEDESKPNVSVNCGIRPVNAAKKSGDWTFSEAATVKEAPVFLRGFENVNVKGWSHEEVIRLIKYQKRSDSVQHQKGAQGRAREKIRRQA